MTAPPDLGPPETDAPVAETPTPLGVWDRIKDHKVLQWAIAYLGAALAIGQAHELIANAFAWPNLVGRIVVSALIVGFPIALTVAWYHGHRALRRISVGRAVDSFGARADRRVVLHRRAAPRRRRAGAGRCKP